MTTSITTATPEATHTVLPSIASLADRLYDLLTLPDGDLDRRMAEMIRSEQELPDPLCYEATLARIRAWLALDGEDARILAGSCNRAMDLLPTEFRWRRTAAERAVLMNALTFSEFLRLAVLLPWLRDEAPAVLAGPPAHLASEAPDAELVEAE